MAMHKEIQFIFCIPFPLYESRACDELSITRVIMILFRRIFANMISFRGKIRRRNRRLWT